MKKLFLTMAIFLNLLSGITMVKADEDEPPYQNKIFNGKKLIFENSDCTGISFLPNGKRAWIHTDGQDLCSKEEAIETRVKWLDKNVFVLINIEGYKDPNPKDPEEKRKANPLIPSPLLAFKIESVKENQIILKNNWLGEYDWAGEDLNEKFTLKNDKFFNPLTDSYGKWTGLDDGSKRIISVSEKGLDREANNKDYCYENSKTDHIIQTQDIYKISGDDILNMVDPDLQNSYSGPIPLKNLKKLIKKHQKYYRIDPIVGGCVDGHESFILLSPNKALYEITGPETTLYLLHKKTN